jgi:c-di-GMP-binding flagellar brake protein YcgR
MEVYLPFQFEMFKLDRRSNFRVKLPDSDQFEVKIFECNGKSLNLLARVKDVSGGGLRLLCNEADAACTLEINNKIKGELYPTKDKIIQFEGVIRHLKRSEGVIEFGVMIVEEHIKSSFRLTALTLTLQRKLIVPSY